MDRNTIIGLLLIFALLMGWQQYMKPKAEAAQAEKRFQDSLQNSSKKESDIPVKTIDGSSQPVVITEPDSVNDAVLVQKIGPFAPAGRGNSDTIVLENKLIKVVFSSKGGKVLYAELKHHFKVEEDDKLKEIKTPLRLLNNPKNKFDFLIPITGAEGGMVNSADLNFSVTTTGNSVIFRADAGQGRYFEQRYTLATDDYQLDYHLNFTGLSSLMPPNTSAITLKWVNYLDKLEKNHRFERNYSTVYFKTAEDSPDYCSCTASDIEDKDAVPIKWIAHANQFFNTAIIADERFAGARMETQMLDEKDSSLKKLITEIAIPFDQDKDLSFGMTMYAGPNEFDRLRALGYQMEDIIPFGTSFLGSINRWIIRPMFNFLMQFIGSTGIVILILTFVVKMVVYPLTYKMLYSQSKMSALKPQLEHLKERYKDDPQQQQVETMKIYREFGVNPLGGCLPSLLQMPIWIALYRFFPASIDFRQSSFLWATDLSSYDVALRLPFELPLGFGEHLSAFTFLWAISTLVYTYYSTKEMDFSANPAMKYMQYIMPLFFLGFFNSYASGLTCYLLFSNLITIAQTIITRNYIIDKEKILAQMEDYRKKPKKKSGWQDRLEQAMKEQQRIQAERNKPSNQNKPKK
jgi:YidC/Oxa1 family membrane protein insertase